MWFQLANVWLTTYSVNHLRRSRFRARNNLRVVYKSRIWGLWFTSDAKVIGLRHIPPSSGNGTSARSATGRNPNATTTAYKLMLCGPRRGESYSWPQCKLSFAQSEPQLAQLVWRMGIEWVN